MKIKSLKSKVFIALAATFAALSSGACATAGGAGRSGPLMSSSDLCRPVNVKTGNDAYECYRAVMVEREALMSEVEQAIGATATHMNYDLYDSFSKGFNSDECSQAAIAKGNWVNDMGRVRGMSWVDNEFKYNTHLFFNAESRCAREMARAIGDNAGGQAVKKKLDRYANEMQSRAANFRSTRQYR